MNPISSSFSLSNFNSIWPTLYVSLLHAQISNANICCWIWWNILLYVLPRYLQFPEISSTLNFSALFFIYFWWISYLSTVTLCSLEECDDINFVPCCHLHLLFISIFHFLLSRALAPGPDVSYCYRLFGGSVVFRSSDYGAKERIGFWAHPLACDRKGHNILDYI